MNDEKEIIKSKETGNTTMVNNPTSNFGLGLIDAANRISEITRPLVESLNALYKDDSWRSQLTGLVANITKNIHIDYDLISNSIQQALNSLYDAIKGIPVPNLSEEQKQEIIESHRVWGTYGWTINPCADFNTLYDKAPDDKKTADRYAMKYCTPKYMQMIFEEIKNSCRVKEKDFFEAVFTFENAKYKSCALLIFSLIDAQLIRLQKRNANKKVGNKAVTEVKKRVINKLDDGEFFSVLLITNLFECLSIVFERGNNFKIQPIVINRNFLGHGMLTRKVLRRDCIQLFLLYYNMLQLLDMVYE